MSQLPIARPGARRALGRWRALLAAAALVLVSGPPPAPVAAQDFPAKTIRLIVAFPPGGSNDIVSRLIASKLADRFGQQVVVDNRAGAGGSIGAELAASAPPDGYTLLLASVAQTVNPWIYKLKYDAAKAFVPVAKIGTGPMVLFIHPSLKPRTLAELLKLLEQEPGKYNLAHSGIGSLQHIASAMFASMTGARYVEVPFKGGGPGMIDVIGGHSHMMIGTIVQSIGHIKSGKLIAIAQSGARRHPALPDVPTFAEAGLPGYEIGNFWAILAPAGTPQAIVERLNAEIGAVQSDPQVMKQIEAEGGEVVRMTPGELGQFLQRQTARMGEIVKATGMKAE